MSSLSQQLAGIRAQQAVIASGGTSVAGVRSGTSTASIATHLAPGAVAPRDNVVPSLLFDRLTASALDVSTLHSLGLNGLTALMNLDSRFRAFEKTLFAPPDAGVSVARLALTPEASADVSASITSFLTLLGPYFLLKPAAKALEWIIRRHRVAELNVEELLRLALPYHASPLFVRIVQISRLNPGSRWGWLLPIQRSGAPLDRSVLVGRLATTDRGLIEFLTETLKASLAADVSHSVLMSFVSTVLLEVVSFGDHLPEQTLRAVMPWILSSLDAQNSSPDMSAAALMVLSQVSARSRLPRSTLNPLTIAVTKSIPVASLESVITFLVWLFHTQDATAPWGLPVPAVKTLAHHSQALPAAIAKQAAGNSAHSVPIRPFLTRLLNAAALGSSSSARFGELTRALIMHLPSDLARPLMPPTAKVLLEAAVGAKISPQKPDGKEHQGHQTSSKAKPAAPLALLRDMELRWPAAVDAATSQLLALRDAEQSPKFHKASPLFGLSASAIAETVFEFASSEFRPGSATAPAPGGSTTLIGALVHPEPAIRKEALLRLGKLAPDDSSSPLPWADSEDAASLGPILLSCLEDADEQVVAAVLSFPRFTELTSPSELMATLLQVANPNSALSPPAAVYDAIWGSALTALASTTQTPEVLRLLHSASALAMVALVLPEWNPTATASVTRFASNASSTLRTSTALFEAVAAPPRANKKWSPSTADWAASASLLPLVVDFVTPALSTFAPWALRPWSVALLTVARLSALSASLDAKARWAALNLMWDLIEDTWSSVVYPAAVPGAAANMPTILKPQLNTFWIALVPSLSSAENPSKSPPAGSVLEPLTTASKTTTSHEIASQAVALTWFVRSAILALPHVASASGAREWPVSDVPTSISTASEDTARFWTWTQRAWTSLITSPPPLVALHAPLLKLLLSSALPEEAGGALKVLAGFFPTPLVAASSIPTAQEDLIALRALELASDALRAETVAPSIDTCSGLAMAALVAVASPNRAHRAAAVRLLRVIGEKSASSKGKDSGAWAWYPSGQGGTSHHSGMWNIPSPKAGSRSALLKWVRDILAAGASDLAADPTAMSRALLTIPADAATAWVASVLSEERGSVRAASAQLVKAACSNADLAASMVQHGASLVHAVASTPETTASTVAVADAVLSCVVEPSELVVEALVSPAVLPSQAPDTAVPIPTWSASRAALETLERTSEAFASISDKHQAKVLSSLLDVLNGEAGPSWESPTWTADIQGVLRSLPFKASHIVAAFPEEVRVTPQSAGGSGSKKRARTSSGSNNKAGGSLSVSAMERATVIADALALGLVIQDSDLAVSAVFSVLDATLSTGTVNSDPSCEALAVALLNALAAMIVPSVNASVLKVDVVVALLRTVTSPAVCRSALATLVSIAESFPSSVLDHVMAVFSWMGGSSTLATDNAHTYDIIRRTVNAVVPAVVASGDRAAIESVVNAFLTQAPAVPAHRRLGLWRVLVDTLGQDPYLGVAAASLVLRGVSESSVAEFSWNDFASSLVAGYSAYGAAVAMGNILISSCRLYSGSSKAGHSNASGLATVQDWIESSGLEGKRAASELLTWAAKSLSVTADVGSKLLSARSDSGSGLPEVFRQAFGSALSAARGDEPGVAVDAMGALTALMSMRDFVDSVVGVLELPGARAEDAVVRTRALEMATERVRMEEAAGEWDAETGSLLMDRLLPAVKQCATHAKPDSDETTAATEALSALADSYASSFPGPFTAVIPALLSGGLHLKAQPAAAVSGCRAVMAIVPSSGAGVLPHVPLMLPALLAMAEGAVSTSGPWGEDGGGVRDPAFDALAAVASSTAVALINPYLERFINVTVSPNALKLASSARAQEALVAGVSPRLLFPPAFAAYTASIRVSPEAGAGVVELVQAIAAQLSREDVGTYHRAVSSFLLGVLAARDEDCRRAGLEALEAATAEAWIALALKLTEAQFVPLVTGLIQWALPHGWRTSDDELALGKSVSLFRVLAGLASRLKGLFVPFAGVWSREALGVLETASSRWRVNGVNAEGGEGARATARGGDRATKRARTALDDGDKGADQEVALSRWVVEALASVIRADEEREWLTAERYGSVFPVLVDELSRGVERAWRAGGVASSYVEGLVIPALGDLAVSVGDVKAWKPLTQQVLLKAREKDAGVRRAAVLTLTEFYNRLGEEFLLLLPETVPSLSELISDSSSEVEEVTRTLVRVIEGYLGESLDTYFQ